MSEPNSKLFREDPAAYYTELGAKAERERIIKFIEDEADKFEAMRPEWYKSVADKMDARIRTIRAIAKRIREQDV